MKIEHMECPRCGASLSPQKGEMEVVCQFCGAIFQVKDEMTLEEIRAAAESKSYGYHKGKLRAEIEADATKKQNSVNVLMPLIIIGGVILFWVVGSAIYWFSLPQVDPFASATVSFKGIDGEGEVKILSNNPEVMINRIEYEFSKEDALCEGDVITVSARSHRYRLTQKTKAYTVEGLTCYLRDLDNIPEGALELIHDRAKSVQATNLSGVSKEELKQMKTAMIYLSTDGARKNCLYEVFETQIETSEEEITCYLVSGFDDVLIDKEQTASVQMSGGLYYGDFVRISTARYITGYESLEAARAGIVANQGIDMELIELDLQ